MIRAILIDDELSSLQNLQQKLEEFCPEVTVVASTQKPEEAIFLIKELKPDIIFLDIEMPKMSGFRMLEEIGDVAMEIVFTTAYNHYAIDAIRLSAFDYLMKPILIADLQNTIDRLQHSKKMHNKEKFEVLKNSILNPKSQNEKITITTNEGMEFIEIASILHIEASSCYSKIYLEGNRQILVTRILKDFEDILVPYKFYRIHNSHLINLKYIQKYMKADCQVMLKNGKLIDISRRKKDEFLKLFI